MSDPFAFLADAPLGTRVVVRTRIHGGYTDALGFLRSRSAASVSVETKRGLVTLLMADVVAAKEVPPAPAPRERRGSPG
ncbi:ferrous iron transport protein A [Cryobacterium sp. TMS1-20-1]|uniref:putative acetyltransferase n=1 Tax=Cryobacterium sp. TMS1-20-1 TaxID=1259223 RepID=UPI0010694BF4|nr:ferrous iron transport protein A [Cryobacterium sp. TMS1-20-1]TFC76748.1 ferrous iron transport protein A [Cryobacterium sp. TMS1-20-1]